MFFLFFVFLRGDEIQCLASPQKYGNVFHRREKAILLKEKGGFSDENVYANDDPHRI